MICYMPLIKKQIIYIHIITNNSDILFFDRPFSHKLIMYLIFSTHIFIFI